MPVPLQSILDQWLVKKPVVIIAAKVHQTGAHEALDMSACVIKHCFHTFLHYKMTKFYPELTPGRKL